MGARGRRFEPGLPDSMAEETYLIADACWCTWGPLEFERGHCARCGHWIDIDVRAEGSVDCWILLDAAIERARLRLLDDAEEDGVDVEDRDAYRSWLEAKIEALDDECDSYSDKVALGSSTST